MTRRRVRALYCVTLVLATCSLDAASANAQTDSAGNIARGTVTLMRAPLLDGFFADSVRTKTLRDTSSQLSLLRSPSSTGHFEHAGALQVRTFLPELRAFYNSALPFSLNDGALWAGRGWNASLALGAEARWRGVRVMMLPEAIYSQNQAFDTTRASRFPPRRSGLSPWSSPFHAQSQRIDLPIRFGDRTHRRIVPGQSSVVISAGPVEYGAATENNWWGPGLQNALLLSNNAEGFPHLFVRSPRPLRTPAGSVEARWMAGGLRESDFFDVNTGNNLRSISALAVTFAPARASGLTVGAARVVWGPVDGWGLALTGFTDVFSDVGTPNAVAYTDTTTVSGPDQLLSLFARWASPADGFEAYVEWGRAEFPKSLRDFLVQPNHTQAYTLGMQWLGERWRLGRGQLRVQAEATFAQQSSTYRFRPTGSWYTSHAVQQGFTNRGQTIGAGIGPGSSSQWLALDHVASRWMAGLYANRIRWLEDARSQTFAGLPPGNGWCEHDVSLRTGGRVAMRNRLAIVAVDYGTGWRHNVFFVHDPNSCPFPRSRNQRERQLRLVISPSYGR